MDKRYPRPVSTEPDYNVGERLIGVELTYISGDGSRTEIDMLVPHDRPVMATSRCGMTYRTQMQVTLHMSSGDRNATIEL